jgi:hypothetical protein
MITEYMIRVNHVPHRNTHASATTAPRTLTRLQYSLFAGRTSANGFISLKWSYHILDTQRNYRHPSFALFRNSSSSIFRLLPPFFLISNSSWLLKLHSHLNPIQPLTTARMLILLSGLYCSSTLQSNFEQCMWLLLQCTVNSSTRVPSGTKLCTAAYAV